MLIGKKGGDKGAISLKDVEGSGFSRKRSDMIEPVKSIIISFLLSIKACAVPIPMRPYTGSAGCSKGVRIRYILPDG